eukprot:CAMPEP_0170271430 /NCGR_PEP_ID=MMETSP0116_2-20130129/35663_1 /TAXON_ID=400756 /ORGANISM="Durinskia baltica, Strain CSIRO CS-38" /LENGTH=235 /DNA_ID=CAMNT_0010522629 /DNA_START=150 /DNA_END=854 /DNA_ORIENTATION=+
MIQWLHHAMHSELSSDADNRSDQGEPHQQADAPWGPGNANCAAGRKGHRSIADFEEVLEFAHDAPVLVLATALDTVPLVADADAGCWDRKQTPALALDVAPRLGASHIGEREHVLLQWKLIVPIASRVRATRCPVGVSLMRLAICFCGVHGCLFSLRNSLLFRLTLFDVPSKHALQGARDRAVGTEDQQRNARDLDLDDRHGPLSVVAPRRSPGHDAPQTGPCSVQASTGAQMLE